MDIHNIITIILTLTFFIIFSYYPKEAAKAQKISLLNMGILITILFLLIFIIKGYSPIVAMQNYELISPILLFGILNLIFLIAKYKLKFYINRLINIFYKNNQKYFLVDKF